MLRSRQQEQEEDSSLRHRLAGVEEAQETRVEATAPLPSETLPEGIPPNLEAWKSIWAVLVRENPVFHKECRGLPGQKRKASRGAILFERGLLGTVAVACYYGLLHLFFVSGVSLEPGAREAVALGLYSVLMGLASLTLVLGPASASNSIPKERTKQTWNALLLTRLTPQQILMGKLLPYYRSVLGFLGFLAPAILLCGALGHVPIWSFVLTTLVAAVTSALAGVLSIRGGLLQRAPKALLKGPWSWGPALAAISPAFTVAIYFVAAFSIEVLKILPGPFQPGPEFHYTALAPNLLNPILSFGLSLPVWDAVPAVPIALRLAIVALYLTCAGLFTRALWRNTLSLFWHAPKDNTG